MKKSTIAIAVLVVLGLSYWGYTSYVASNTAPTPTPIFEAEEFDRVVSATGEVVPTRWAQLSFKIGGRLDELAVQEGDRVEAGYVLARLEMGDLERQVEQAQAGLVVSQANLAQIQAGATAGDFVVAEAALTTAQASLAQVKAGARPEEIAAAQEALAEAQAGVSAAKANLASAQAELARLEAGAKPEELTAAQAAMSKAAVALQLAQSEYDKISWQSGLGATQQAVALQQASTDYESAKANYEALVRGATAEELDIARAAVEAARAQVDVAQAQAEQAKAQLDQLLAGPTAKAIAVTEAQVGEAQAQLVKLREGPRPEDIAVAEAQIQQAQTAVAQAQAALQDAELAAPFTGTVAGVTVREGELMAAGQPVMFLGDLSRLRIETTDLNEADIWAIAVGQEVTLTFDGLPGKALSGRVTRIAPMATMEQGGTNYTVVVELDEQDPGLRWGMTAYVDITVQ
jgi:HlyD family secretion protein